MTNPVFPFEIPVSDMDRAKAFYESAFGYRLDSNPIWLNRGDSPLADFLIQASGWALEASQDAALLERSSQSRCCSDGGWR